MIRKWSYLTVEEQPSTTKSLNSLTKCYSFKVFRMTTRFKKYQRTGTSFVRKQDASRKRQTSWLTLLSIFAQWSLQYIKYRQYLRYYQSRGVYTYQFIIPNIFVIHKKINLYNPQFTFITSTLTRQLLLTFQLMSNKTPTQLVGLNTLSTNCTLPDTLQDVNVSAVIYDNQTFMNNQLLSPLHTQTAQILNQVVYNNVLSQVTRLYQVNILLSLHQTNVIYYEISKI